MAETRARPAREAQRFQQIVRANLWFWRKMRDIEDTNYDLLIEWNGMADAVKIRRWRAATPQDQHESDPLFPDDKGEDDAISPTEDRHAPCHS